ncbi:hypothetical protein [Pleionea sediminis]|uniref:hypothetical protein n=1 Tax=Pleionea sediminis TaxID=2569479 RepID=UPI00118609E5|nr:hypothetical protein [Pleionea sediminis]
MNRLIGLLSVGIILSAIFGYVLTKESESEASSGDLEFESTSRINTDIQRQEVLNSASSEQNTNLLINLNQQLQKLTEQNKQFEKEIAAIKNTLQNSQSSQQQNAIQNIEPETETNPELVFEQHFLNESIDENWSLTAEDHFRRSLEQLSNNINDLQVNDIACSTSLCRLEYKLGSEENIQTSIQHIGNQLDWDSKSFSEYSIDDNGQVTIKGFYMREGYDYPTQLVGAN